MAQENHIIIVGASHAGAQAAINLRQMGYDGAVTLISAEHHLPYERPPLSKEYLSGKKPFERLLLRPEKFWAERDINLMLKTRVIKLDSMMKTITLSNGDEMHWSKLIWAGGGSPRMLDCPGSDALNVFTVRSRNDIDNMTQMLPDAQNVAIIGGGYIGLESAAVLREMGKNIVILEAMDRLLSRVAGTELADFYEAEHRARGVDICLSTRANRFTVDDKGHASHIETEDGEKIPCDIVISGIGIIPSVGPLIAEGASGANGVDIDEYCRTSLRDIYAIGDCAAHANPYANGRHIRLESVQNAHDQAKVAAAHIMGEEKSYGELPWFWSNQYDLKLQTVGLAMDYDQEIVRGDKAEKKFSVAYLRAGKLIALDAVNRPKDYVQARKRILEDVRLDAAQIADVDIPLKEVERA